MKMNELKDGYKGELRALLTSVGRGVTNKGAPYLSFTLQDNTGTMDAKYWNVPETLLNEFVAGQVIDVYGDVISHQKQLQFRVQKATKIEQDNIDIAQYVPQGPYSKQELEEKIEHHLNQIANTNIAKIVISLLEDHKKDFYEYPAATKNHHDFVGGLATHVLGMLMLCDSLCSQYVTLNRDLLIAGVFLHDIGKLKELSGAVISEYTIEGKLLGHISMMQAEVAKKAIDLGVEGEEVILLRHMILSHHGVYEYGSPVLPMIPEAEMLYLIDNIDARMNTMEKALSNVQPGEFTQRVFALDNRNFYKSNLK